MIKEVNEAQQKELEALLSAAKLPVKDLDLHKQKFIGFYQDGNIMGASALEYYDDTALLRSVVVDPTLRNTGLGKKLVKAAEQEAISNGISRLFLLTETAKDFFTHLGYEVVSRDTVPELMKKSSEFSHVCPASAICMMINLQKTI